MFLSLSLFPFPFSQDKYTYIHTPTAITNTRPSSGSNPTALPNRRNSSSVISRRSWTMRIASMIAGSRTMRSGACDVKETDAGAGVNVAVLRASLLVWLIGRGRAWAWLWAYVEDGEGRGGEQPVVVVVVEQEELVHGGKFRGYAKRRSVCMAERQCMYVLLSGKKERRATWDGGWGMGDEQR